MTDDIAREYGWLHGEIQTWGPSVFGGGISDQRAVERCREDLRGRLDPAADTLAKALQLRRLEAAAGLPTGDLTELEGALLKAQNLVALTHRRLRLLAELDEMAQRRAVADKDAAELRRQLGLAPLVPALSVDEWHAYTRKQVMDRLAYERDQLTPAELAARDPNTPAGKERVRRELDARDPVVQGKLGNSIPPNSGDGRAASDWKPVEAPAQPARRSLVAEIRRRVIG